MSDGTKIDLPDAGVVIFVGPNNAGKSQSLKDLRGLLREEGYQGRSVRSAQVQKEGTDLSSAEQWATRNLRWVDRDGLRRTFMEGWGEVALNDFASYWAHSPLLGPLTDSFVLFADGSTRLSAGDAAPNLDFRSAYPSHPIQRAAQDPDLEEEINQVSLSAFGLGATVDRFAGSVLPLRLGQRPTFEHNNGAPTAEYLHELERVSPVEQQGDGVRSFIGLALSLLAGSHQILMVDEPEAFLHPPQARLLGRFLADRASDRQVFIATHSADVVRGALESSMPVTIVRLKRNGSSNEAAVLSHGDVTTLWSDPILKYSEVLSGLFHDAVVVCESDSDCRYYAAVRDHLHPDGGGLGRRPELLFTHCGGKARLAVVVRALRAVQVPVIVVADFDILRGEQHLRDVIGAAGGDWETISADHKVLNSALQAGAKQPSRTAVKEGVVSRLDAAQELLTSKDLEDLRRILKSETGWDKAKAAGIGGVPQGAPAAAAERILATAQTRGVLIVPVGELERFEPTIPGHGPAWVNAVLSADKHTAPSRDALEFVSKLEMIALQESGLGTEPTSA